MEKELETKFDQVHESIDKLATMVADGFSAVDKRFEQVDQRFEQVDQRFDAMDQRFDAVDKRFDKVEVDIAELKIEIRSIRAELERLPEIIDATYAGAINDLFERVSVIERKLGIAV